MPALRSTIGRACIDLAARIIAGGPTVPQNVWGDGIVDQSLTTLWYPCDWGNVSEDELVFLLPSLMSKGLESDLSSPCGPSTFVRRALCARLHRAVLTLSSDAVDRDNGSKDVVEKIAMSGVITTLDPFTAWTEGAAPFSQLYMNSSLAHPEVTLRRNRSPLEQDIFNAWVRELTILACLDCFLRDASVPADPSRQDRSHPCPLNLANKLVAAIYSSFNAAYIYRDLVSMHELFTVGAWLGSLVRGRSALMPVVVADFLIDTLVRTVPDDASDASRWHRVMRYHADLAAGIPQLLKVARRVRATGCAGMTRPRPARTLRGDASNQVWDDELSSRIGERLRSSSVM